MQQLSRVKTEKGPKQTMKIEISETVHTTLLKRLSWCNVEIPCHLVYLQLAVDVATFVFLLL